MVKVGAINRNFPKFHEKKYDFNKYVASFAIATLIFVIGLIVGNYFGQQNISKINAVENDLKLDIMSLELQDTLLRQDPCSFSASSLEYNLEDLESRINMMETQLGKTDKDVLELKKYYSLLEIKHYLLMSERKDKCGANYSLVLFFYSNTEGNILNSEKQGYVLDNLRQTYGAERIKVYSLDVDTGLDIVSSLMEIHNITGVPSLVVNNATFEGYSDKEELMNMLGL